MKLLYKTVANPYIVFTLIWSVALVLYLFQWSDIFPKLSTGLFCFISLAILLQLLLGAITSRSTLFSYSPLPGSSIELKDVLFIINLIAWLLNFAYSGLPLFKILRGDDFDYRLFGMPTVIVFAMSFNSFLCVYYFHIYLTTKSKIMFIYIGLCLMYYLLIFSRGMILMTGMSMFFLWLASQHRAIRLRFVMLLLLTFAIIMYVFGVAGNIRTSQLIASTTGKSSSEYNSQTILTIGSASERFRNSIVPNEYFWSYIYIASPLSNLQYNIINKPPADYSLTNLAAFGINEFSYDFISKRLNSVFDIEPKKPLLLVEELTVCTMFAESYRYLGWAGLVIMLMFVLAFPVIYARVIGVGNEYIPISCAILTNIYFFSFFDNMLVYSGLGLQLVYPFLLKKFNAYYRQKVIQSQLV